jgi:hypothetical protein
MLVPAKAETHFSVNRYARFGRANGFGGQRRHRGEREAHSHAQERHRARICHGWSCHSANDAADAATSSIPAANGHFIPTQRPIRPAIGPANKSVSELGSRYRPAFVALAWKP